MTESTLFIGPTGCGQEQAAYDAALQHAGSPSRIRRPEPLPSGSIGIDAIRALLSDWHLHHEHPFAILIDACEKLSLSAANALLKPIEEPTQSGRFFLSTDRPTALPAPLLSRMEKSAVSRYRNLAQYKEDFPERFVDDGRLATVAFVIAEGRADIAKALTSEKAISLYDTVCRLPLDRKPLAGRRVAARALAEGVDFPILARAMLRRIAAKDILKKPLTQGEIALWKADTLTQASALQKYEAVSALEAQLLKSQVDKAVTYQRIADGLGPR